MSIVSCQEIVEASSVDNPISTDDSSNIPGAGISMDIAMNSRIAELEQRIAVLEAQGMGVEQLKKDLEAIKAEFAKLANDTKWEEIEELQNQIDALAGQIKKTSSTMVTGVVLQETLDCVVGTINLHGFNPAILAVYIGENNTGMPEFPISGTDYNVDPNGYYLLNKELPTDDELFVGNNGKSAYLLNGTGNAGMLYFTINPRKVDPSLFEFSLISFTGEESPFKLTEVLKSDHQISNAIDKQGNGLTRNDYAPEGDNAPEDDNIQKANTNLYEAKATCEFEGVERIHYDCIRFGYENVWDAGCKLTGVTQGSDAQANNMFGRYQYLAGAVKSKTIDNELEATLKIIQDFYNGVYGKRDKLKKQALRVSWDDGENDVVSGFDITSVIINPLNFKQIFLLDNVSMPWSFKNFEKELGNLVKTIQTNASGVTSVTLKSVSTDGIQPKLTYTAGDTDVVVDITEEVYNAINNGMELAIIGNMVNSILHPYQKASRTSSSTMSRVVSYLDKNCSKAMTDQGGNVAWNGVEPILLFENSEGITQLHSNMTINGSGSTTFIMTSLSEEYIVPAYLKYIAVIQNGALVDSYLYEGKEKIAQLSLPIGESEIVYHVSDYYGNIVTKRYFVKREQ